ncbi:MAG: CoB--CoM heterodisulfide reductase iron-sulfur subunit A family protein [Candidatus Methanofastidiosa archaeon]|nr:CoB--CoM heterodisulfide reductase iron-sulfur subunit A family protein [Candidatus Methanofastidiosa archaeon]
MKRIGVFICHCGVNISNTVDVKKVVEEISKIPSVVACADYQYMCSDPGQDMIKKAIKENQLDSVVVAACSPRMHEPTFRATVSDAGMNPYCFEMSNIREQCSWVHLDGEKATKKAIDLVKSSVARASLLEPLVSQGVPVVPKALVIGGGIAGIQTSLDIANSGYKVYLVEKEPSIGGHMARFDKTFPTLDCAACILTPKMVDVARHPNIELLTYSEVESIDGSVGNFHVRVKKNPRYVDMEKCTGCGSCAEACRLAGRIASEFDMGLGKRGAIYVPFPQAVPLRYTIDPEKCLFLKHGKCGTSPKCADVCTTDAIKFDDKPEFVEFDVGAIVVATGFKEFSAELKPEYCYDKYPNVMTGLELERIFAPSGPTGGKPKINGKEPKRIVFISCVGSRDKKVGNAYCSRVCCMYIAKQAHLLKEKIPDADITVMYTDMRAFGKGYEEFYERVQKEGIKYRRGNAAEVYGQDGKLFVRAEDTLLGEPYELEADLVVLGTGLTPNPLAEGIGKLLHLSLSSDGFFLEAHPKLRPVDTVIDGVFLAGVAQGPKDIPDTVAQASGAASHVVNLLSKDEIFAEPTIAVVDEDACVGCKTCMLLCPFEAHEFDEEKGVMKVNAALCKGCGSCAAACPSGSIRMNHFTNDQIIAQLLEVL